MKLRTRFENLIKRRLLRITSSPLAGYSVAFLPIESDRVAYMLPPAQTTEHRDNPAAFPIPPKQLQLGYGKSPQDYLHFAQKHVQSMLGLLATAGYTIQPEQRVLEFGCAEGRMTRWLLPFAQHTEIWGCDLSAPRIAWCEQHLSPPFHFFTNTVWPHLPFEDRAFDLIYAGSVFTHIDDLAKTWLLELRRVLRPGGYLYITIHDEHTIRHLNTTWRDTWLARYMHAHTEYWRFQQGPFAMFTIGRALQSQVFYKLEHLCSLLETIFDVVSVTPGAYAYQTGIVLQKRSKA